ncbi:MAG TPA: endonuclease/exonuclease/phosphatase family protein [Phycisphaerae bacterium]|nr:endonuclease/exonuclease/phosphatase family protein [Phycisphaerae bacterium]
MKNSLRVTLFILLMSAGSAIAGTVRVATFNIWELTEKKLSQTDDTGHGTNRQLKGAAEIIQRVRPDILLINEIDVGNGDASGARQFCKAYLAVSQNGQAPIEFEHIFVDEVNTGSPSGFDLDNDGNTNGPGDAWGYGQYAGQYGMAILSRFPIDQKSVRTFRHLKWRDMPGALICDGTNGKPDWYTEEEAKQFPLSSKSHWDVPIDIDGQSLHLLCSHPTPPVFDGNEDRNGRRNFDEIRLWADYISGGKKASYIKDDQGKQAALATTASFVILGDLNADPTKDPAPYGQPAINQLLNHERIKPNTPKLATDKTCDFGRIDYVLPSTDLKVKQSGVFTPNQGEELHRLIQDRSASSDHRLVWIDIEFDKG